MVIKKPKEGVKTENSNQINLKVMGQDGSVSQCKIKRHTLLSKRMQAYCELQNLSTRQIRFPIWRAANQWNRYTCTVGNGGWKYNWCVTAADNRCLLKRELYSRTLFLQTKNTFSVRKPQFGSTTSWRLLYSFLYSFLFPLPILLLYIKWKWNGKNTDLVKIPLYIMLMLI